MVYWPAVPLGKLPCESLAVHGNFCIWFLIIFLIRSYAEAIPKVAVEFGISEVVAALGTSLFLFGYESSLLFLI